MTTDDVIWIMLAAITLSPLAGGLFASYRHHLEYREDGHRWHFRPGCPRLTRRPPR